MVHVDRILHSIATFYAPLELAIWGFRKIGTAISTMTAIWYSKPVYLKQELGPNIAPCGT